MLSEELKQQAAFISSLDVFDKSYYLSQFEADKIPEGDLIYHYSIEGWKQGYDPCIWFDTNYYLLAYPDILKADINPFFHFLKLGIYENRLPSESGLEGSVRKKIISSQQVRAGGTTQVVDVDRLSHIGIEKEQSLNDTLMYHIDSNKKGIVEGWIYSKVDKHETSISIDLLIDDVLVDTIKPDLDREDLSTLKLQSINYGFYINTSIYTSSLEYKFELYAHNTNELLLEDTVVHTLEDGNYENVIKEGKVSLDLVNETVIDESFISQLNDYGFRFSIDINKNGIVAGWIYEEADDSKSVIFEIFVNNVYVKDIIATQLREDLAILELSNLNHGFYIDINSYSSSPLYTFSIYEKSTQKSLLENENVFPLTDRVQALLDLQTYLRKQKYHTRNNILDYQTVMSILPSIIDKLRSETLFLPNTVLLPEDAKKKTIVENLIEVIIPVYKGVKETENCILSALNATNVINYKLTVINDKSPEPDMYSMLNNLSINHDFDLINNEENLGFVKTVNIGMRRSHHDVILLNSDTVVSDGWLDAIYFEAYQSANSESVGTVTPMSNNATICSFPRFCVDNEIPQSFSLEEIVAYCRDNAQPAVDLPTAHGYCMFIKRSVLELVGYFDEQKWGMGYAEENDFSLRASNYGWRHVMTNKTFVHHLGSVSFAEDTDQFIQINLQKLNELYPDYPQRVTRFVEEDPVRFLRNELAERLLIVESRKQRKYENRSFLFVNLTIGGGTQKAVDDLGQALILEGQNTYTLTARLGTIWKISSMVSNLEAEYQVKNIEEYNNLITLLKELGVWHIHYHHVLEFSKQVWDIPRSLKCEYDVTLHDFYTICPRVNLLTVDNMYCGIPSNEFCNSNCLSLLGVHPSSYLTMADFEYDINKWHSFYSTKLSAARQVFTPSKDTKNRILQKIPLENIIAQYHPEHSESILFNPPSYDDKILRIGFIGAIGPHKGIDRIKDLVTYIDANNLTTEICIFGYTSDDEFFKEFNFVNITGPYAPSDLENLLTANPVNVVFLTSIWPETFGYTYSEVIRLGLPIVSFDIGAIPERAENKSNVLIVSPSLNVKDVLDEISLFIHNLVPYHFEVGQGYDSILDDYYNL